MTLFAKFMTAALGTALLAPAAIAQAPRAAAPAARPAPGAPAPTALPTVSIPGVSPAGNAALTRIARTEDPVQKASFQKLEALGPQVAATVNAPAFDVEKFAALMRQIDRLQSDIKTRVNERLIASVKALPPADRVPFLKAISTQRAGQPQAR